MKVNVRQIENKKDEQVIIECIEVTQEVEEIQKYVLTKGTALTGSMEGRVYQFKLDEVFYFEAVGERVFAYTDKKVYEMKIRLYQLESAYAQTYFIRGSKSVLLNLMKLESISPALNGRFTAHLKNGEKLIISRQYAAVVINSVMGGK